MTKIGETTDNQNHPNEDIILSLAPCRLRKGISLEQIAAVTKIGVRSLEAIERGEFEKLPGGIYNTSYLRQYARQIDFDESKLVEYYHAKMGITPPQAEVYTGSEQVERKPILRLVRHSLAAFNQ
ncbi:MAG: helix-turn-helix domain-containing protein [Bryobacteraceae bacterium]